MAPYIGNSWPGGPHGDPGEAEGLLAQLKSTEGSLDHRLHLDLHSDKSD